ncbi:hypothetical protein UR09_02930 [Candidatus Nitromaritima sp. SCGC AAA799-A02]|nr:hypothetical protein UR09_02930 [Candidatus Nitromaritima sp. SCGC AAA799-A02]
MITQKALRKKREFGFTLVEIIVVIAVAGIIVITAAPMVSTWMERNRLNGIARKISNDLLYCRQKAISENMYYIVDFTSATPITYTIKKGQVLGTYTDVQTISLPESKDFITFTASGDPVFNYRGMANGQVTLTISNANNDVRTVVVTLGGKISTS